MDTPLTNYSATHKRRVLSTGMFLICFSSIAGPCGATLIFSELQSAGPQNYAILVGPGTTDFAMNGPGTTNGNVGYDGTNQVQLNGSAGPEINGNLYLATGASVNNTAQVTGSVFSNYTPLTAAWASALMASSDFSALIPTQSVPGGRISGTTTINSAGGTNVIDLTSLNLGNGQTLTLNGSAPDQFIINDTGNFVLNSGRIILTGGLTTTDVVFNVTASGNAVQTSGGLNNESIVNGILLAVQGGIAFAPGLINGELIAGGSTVHLVSGASVNQPPENVPEPSTYFLWGTGLLGLGSFKFKRTA
jgi:hypothetical protein